MLSYIYKTRNLEGGVWLVVLIFLSSWGSDTCAYCVGRLIGRHKMAPVLSPKKSVEGAVGGVVTATVVALLFGLAVENIFSLPGLGYRIVNSLTNRDLPVIYATVLFLAFALVIFNILADIIQRLLQTRKGGL